MKTKYFLILALLSLAQFSFAQTPNQIKKITKNYNKTLLMNMHKVFLKQYKKEKAEALAYAKENNIDVYITYPDGGFAELQKVDANGTLWYYRTLNADAAISTRTNHLNIGGSTGFDLDGQNMTAYVWDLGHARESHQEFDGPGGNDRISIQDATSEGGISLSSHATHVVGTIGASGVVPTAKGMAPRSQVKSYTFNLDLAEATEAAANGMLVSNHSYGFSSTELPDLFFGAYMYRSRDWDFLQYNTPYYLMVTSAGNDGNASFNGSPLDPTQTKYDKLSGFQTSKNNLVVANAQDATIDSNGDLTSVNIRYTSSQGPTDDYRIKPDITGNGTGLYSTTESSDTSYGYKTGTSMASPNVSGSLLLLQEHHHNLFNKFMRSATLKGLALHTADDAGMTGPDAIFGWGLLNAKKAAETLSNKGTGSIVEELILSNGETFSITVDADGINDLIASISWTDPAGDPTSDLNNTTPRLVNDLDLKITKNTDEWFPWRLTGVNTNAKDSDNFRDPFEQIEIDNPSGTYTITVTHKGTLTDGIQNYSLIVTGITNPTSVCKAPQIISTSDIGFHSATLSWNISVGEVNGYEWVIMPTGVAPDVSTATATGNTISGVNSVDISGLSTSTSYDAYIRSNCVGGSISAWSDAMSFQTYSDLCGANFFDDGGSSGNYSDNLNETTVIAPNTASDIVEVTFSSFSLEDGKDALLIYDGPDTSAPLIWSGGSGFSNTPDGSWTGSGTGLYSAEGKTFTSTHPSGALTFVFISDSNNNEAGWEAVVTCFNPCDPLISGNIDTDSDGIADTCDLDDDNDGVFDLDEQAVENVALTGTAIQSSTDFGSDAVRAIDGNTNGDWDDGSVTLTSDTLPTEYWEVDLGGVYNIADIVFYNRIDRSYDRIRNVYVLVSETPFPIDASDLNGSLTNADFTFQFASNESAAKVTIPVNKSGRYVRLQKSGINNRSNILSIAELEVYAILELDSDSDGIADHLELDSDNDGCSDANEYYEDRLADGGDGGAFGTGSPTVDADGKVTTAGYDGVGIANVKDDSVSRGCYYIQNTEGNWNTDANWLNGNAPQSSDNAFIKTQSTVVQNQTVNNLYLDTNSQVDISSTKLLNIKGHVTNDSRFIGDGEVILNGTINQELDGDGEYKNLKLDNAHGADVKSSTLINGVLYVDQGTFSTNNATTFPCDFSATNQPVGQIGPVNGTISGDVTVEQCFPARRAFRLISSSVTTSTTIKANWQEGLNNNGLNYPIDNNSGTAAFGTHITGSQTGANGFDASPSGNPSLFIFSNENNQQWNAVGNTDVNTLAAGEAYRLLVRGDRTINVTSNAASPTDTKLRSTGQVLGTFKDFSPNIETGKYAFFGNPYQAVVDMNLVINDDTNGGQFTDYFTIWDPTLGGTPMVGQPGGRGAFVTVKASDGTAILGSSATAGDVTAMSQFLQPYQAFFVQAAQDDPSLTFDQADKSVKENQVTVFSTTPSHYIRMTIFDLVSFNNNDTADDGLVIYFSPDHTNTVDVNDAPKFFNIDENLARNENNRVISYENRAMPQPQEVLELYTSQYRTTNYVFQIEVGDFPDNSVYLNDNYTGTETLLDNNNLNTFNFSVDQSIVESVATDRFEIKFKSSTFSTNDFEEVGISVYPNPVQDIVTLNLSQFNGKANQLTVFEVTGRLIDNYSFENKDSFEIDMSNYASGLYILKIKTETDTLQHKLIKE